MLTYNEKNSKLFDDGEFTYNGERAKTAAPIMTTTHDPLTEVPSNPIIENAKIGDHYDVITFIW